jgi:predicted esterase
VTLIHLTTSIHGRVLIEDAAVDPSAGLLVAFHGYGERADDVLFEVNRIPGVDAWTRVAPQALHRFYSRRHERVVASWMTREDRELATADNLEYVRRALARIDVPGPVVYLGFSQGASMAYRAAMLGERDAGGIIAVAGDIPPEAKTASSRPWPRVLIAAGARDEWFATKVDADLSFLSARGVSHDVIRYDGAHEWTDELHRAIGDWLGSVRSAAR